MKPKGENAIEIWEGHAEDESGGIKNIYKLTDEDRLEIKAIIAEERADPNSGKPLRRPHPKNRSFQIEQTSAEARIKTNRAPQNALI